MTSKMRDPTSGGRGARGIDQLPGQIDREDTTPLAIVERLRRRLGVSPEVAALVAQLAGLGPQTVRR